jgi:hypothetical protein
VQQFGHIESWLMLSAFLLLFLCGSANAQGNATLSISMQAQPSIGLIFQNDANVGNTGYCALGNSGTNSVTLDLGTAWWLTYTGCGAFSRINPFGTYQVASTFDVVVSKSNSSSASYKLAAMLSTTPPANVTWLVNGTALNKTSYTTLDTADSYGTAIGKQLQVQVYWSVAAGALQETIAFLATAN